MCVDISDALYCWQVLHFVGLLTLPKQDSADKSYYYTEQDLPHMINPLEAKLGQSLRA